MGMFEYSYALQQFHSAVTSLATGPGDVRSRLRSVWYGSLIVVRLEQLPNSLQKDFEFIHYGLHRIKEEHRGQLERLRRMEKIDPTFKQNYSYQYPDPLEATLKRIKNSTGAKLATLVDPIVKTINHRV